MSTKCFQALISTFLFVQKLNNAKEMPLNLITNVYNKYVSADEC